jgi:ribose-phosphate pyrophosphokinase
MVIPDYARESEERGLLVFTGNSNRALAQAVCHELNVPLGKALCTRFSDGEVQVEIEENVRKQEVFVMQSTGAPTADNFMELLVLIDALKRASAASVIAARARRACRSRRKWRRA